MITRTRVCYIDQLIGITLNKIKFVNSVRNFLDQCVLDQIIGITLILIKFVVYEIS